MKREVLNHLVIVVLSVSVVFMSCNKDDDNFYNPQKKDVYVAGSESNAQDKSVAKLWKNGIAQNLTDGTCNAVANSVFISGGDVYVVGYEYDTQDKSVAKLWKNGKAQNLTDGTYDAEAYSIFVSGSDVYVAGFEASGQEHPEWYGTYNRYVAKLWKNGVAQNLTDGTFEAKANSVYVSDGDVYVVGYERRGEYGYYYAKLWKNGIVENISNNNSIAYSVFVSGNNVYAAGWDAVYQSAAVWTNNVSQILATGSMQTSFYAKSVYVSGGDVYVVGNSSFAYHSMASWYALFWKNGENISSNYGASAYSVCVTDNDVYVAGHQSGIGATIWKNGIAQELSKISYSSANSVFVVE